MNWNLIIAFLWAANALMVGFGATGGWRWVALPCVLLTAAYTVTAVRQRRQKATPAPAPPTPPTPASDTATVGYARGEHGPQLVRLDKADPDEVFDYIAAHRRNCALCNPDLTKK